MLIKLFQYILEKGPSEPRTPVSAVHGFDYSLNTGYASDSSNPVSMDTTPRMLIANLHHSNNIPAIKVR